MIVETPSRAGPAARWLAAAALAVLPAVLISLTYLAWRERLPEPMPTHWNRHGELDGFTSRTGVLALVLGIAGTGALLGLLAVGVTRWAWRIRRILVTVAASVAAFGGGLWLVLAIPALGHTDASTVSSPSWEVVALLIGIAAWAGLAFLACGAAPAHPAAAGRPERGLPRLDLPQGQRAVWSEVTRPGLVAYALLAFLLILAAVLTALINPWAASPLILTAALVFFLFTTRLVVNRRGLHIGFGPWGWPRLTVPLTEIEAAEVTVVRPAEWGGWGYRVRPGGRAVVNRGGPGVRLRLSESRVFETTTRAPDTVAGLVNTLLDHVPRR